jgi:hypothetical protein
MASNILIFFASTDVLETVARIPGHLSLHVLHGKCGGFGGALRLGLLATCPVPIVHGSVLACVPDRPVFASCDSAGWPAPRHSRSTVAQQFPLMTCESYTTMVADSSVSVSTVHFRLLQRFLDST